MADDDPILDILMRVQRALGIDGIDSMLAAVEREARRYWGGERVYIARRQNVKARNEAIRRDYRSGAGITELANKYRLTHRRIRQIVHG